MMGSGDGWMFFGGGYMWLIWVLLIIVVLYALRQSVGGGAGGTTNSDEKPLDILKRRFAQGDIDEEEYLRRRKELER